MVSANRSTFRYPVLLALLLLAALAAPAPVEAGSCEGCVYELWCVGGATCWTVETCSKEARNMSSCWLDPHGHCWTSGGFCQWVLSTPSPLALPTDGLTPQRLLVCDAQAERFQVTIAAS